MEQMKGQFMVVSAVVAGLITIAISSVIADVQSQDFSTDELPKNLNNLKQEAGKITRDGDITEQEKRNFRKMTGYMEGYRTSVEFNSTEPCVTVTLQSTDIRIETPCLS
ncbi:MAG: hypothetical protein ABEJ95_07120 [Candidatus Nanohalobium sp.]